MIPVETEAVFESHARAPGEAGVTVIVSLYNYESYIAHALESVFRQSHSDIELIIVDDGSKDDSRAVAQAWMQQKSGRFSLARLLAHSTNRGLAQARNTAFAHANNEFVFVLDADNELYPEAIAKLAAACRSSGAEAAYSQLEYFGGASGPGTSSFWNPTALATGNYIDAMALIRKSAWEAVGGYTHIEFGWEDYDLWCKFVERGFRGVFVPEILCRYRIHDASMLHRTTSPNRARLSADMMRRHPWLRLEESRSSSPAAETPAGSRPARVSTRIAIGKAARDFYFRQASADVAELQRIFGDRRYDLRRIRRFPQLARWAAAQAAKGVRPLIVDSGAGIGASTLYFAAGFPDGLLIAIEPDRANFELLVRNVSSLNVQPLCSAIGASPGLAVLDDDCGPNGYRTRAVSAAEQAPNTMLQVTINQIYESYHAIASPFVVKIDLMSADKDLFSANTEWIDRTPVIVIDRGDGAAAVSGETARLLQQQLARPHRDLFSTGGLTCSMAKDFAEGYAPAHATAGHTARHPG